MALGQLSTAAGYAAVLPSAASLPPGYQLAEVTLAPTAQPTGNEGKELRRMAESFAPAS